MKMLTEAEAVDKYPVFKPFPIGTQVIRTVLHQGIFQVTGYLVSNYPQTDVPWYALALERIVGQMHPPSEERYLELVRTLVAGRLAKLLQTTVCAVTDYHSGPVKLSEVRSYFHGNNALFHWRHSYLDAHDWFYHVFIAGHLVSMCEPLQEPQDLIFSSMGNYDPTENEEDGWLVDVAWYLRKHARKE